VARKAARRRAPPSGREEQARERRRQLVAIAGALIEAEGVDSVTLPRVTERAGCARTLAYRYFASREELLRAVLEDYFERLDARVSEAEQRAAVKAFVEASRARAPDAGAARRLVALFWDVQSAAGLGGAILRSTPLLSPGLRALVDACSDRYERRFLEPIRGAGMTEAEARTALDLMIASFVRLTLRERAGEIGRRKALDLHTRASLGLLRGLVAG
jgi:AcrR family transcriptional regulator